MHPIDNGNHVPQLRPASAALTLAAALALLLSAYSGPAHGLTETTTVQVVAARDLVGRTVHDAAGVRLGEARYVLIDIDLGVLLGLAVEPDETSKGLLVVPWQSVDVVASDHGLVLSKRERELSSSTRLPRDRLAELTKPQLWRSIGDTDGETRPGADDTADPKETGAAEGSKPRTQLLVGRTVVQILDGPKFRFADQVSGANVATPNEPSVGEIDEVVLDWEHGRVAYVVIAQGGFLGIGTRWVPVPLSTLHWQPKTKRFELSAADALEFKEMEALDASRTPRRVRYADLEKLYERWNAAPYWQDDAPATS